MKHSVKNFHQNLLYLVETSSLALSTIARKAGVNKSTLHNYINGSLPNSLITIESLANFFQVRPEDLVYGDLTEVKQTRVDCDSVLEYQVKIIIQPVKK